MDGKKEQAKDTNTQDSDMMNGGKSDHKKRGSVIKILLSIVLLLLIPLLLVGGWLGFVPGLSNIMGARSVKDLGVTYTEQDYASYLATTNTSFLNIDDAPAQPDNPDKKVVFADQATAENMVLSQEEITAAINESNWAWMPLKDVQVRMNDGDVEVAGRLNTDHLRSFITFIGGVDVDPGQVESAIGWAERLLSDAPVYLRADTRVSEGSLEFNLVDGNIGRFSIPTDIGNTVLRTGTESVLSNTPLLDISSAEFQNESLEFSGAYPSTVYVKTQ